MGVLVITRRSVTSVVRPRSTREAQIKTARDEDGFWAVPRTAASFFTEEDCSASSPEIKLGKMAGPSAGEG